MGKGSHARPVDKQKFDQNFDKVFGKKKKKKQAEIPGSSMSKAFEKATIF